LVIYQLGRVYFLCFADLLIVVFHYRKTAFFIVITLKKLKSTSVLCLVFLIINQYVFWGLGLDLCRRSGLGVNENNTV